jgi:hypothetical protein
MVENLLKFSFQRTKNKTKNYRRTYLTLFEKCKQKIKKIGVLVGKVGMNTWKLLVSKIVFCREAAGRYRDDPNPRHKMSHILAPNLQTVLKFCTKVIKLVYL